MPTAQFWLERWQLNETGWHQAAVNSQLDVHLENRLKDSEIVFLPMCGKTRDMLWFRERDCKVIGVELSELAVHAFFEENGLTFEREKHAGFDVFRSRGIDLFVGNYFALPAEAFAQVSLVYDRGALVAMDPDVQAAYVAKMRELLPPAVRTLLLTVQYGGDMSGPPFSIDDGLIRTWYEPLGAVELLEEEAVDEPRFTARGGKNLVQRAYWIAAGQGG